MRDTGSLRGRGSWEGAAERERRLYLAQVAVIVVAAVLALALVAGLGPQISAVNDTKERDQGEFQALVGFREQMRAAEVTYWRERAEGGQGVSSAVRVGALAAPAILRGLADADHNFNASERTVAEAAVVSATELVALLREVPTPGSPRDRELTARSGELRRELASNVGEWIAAERRELDAAGAEARTDTRRLMMILVGLLVGIAIAAVAAWFLIGRARRHVGSALVRQVEQRRALVSALQDGLLAVGPDGRVVEVNDRLCEMTGFGRDELVGTGAPRPFWRASDADELTTFDARVLRGVSIERDLVFRRADGSDLPAMVSFSARAGGAREFSGYVATVKDATIRRRAEAELRRRAAEQAALGRVAAAVAAFDGSSPGGLYAGVAHEAASLLGVEAARVARFEDGNAEIVGAWSDPERVGDPAPVLARLPLDADTAIARVYRSGRPERVDDFRAIATPVASQIARRYRSAVAAPVRVGGTLWGAVSAVSTVPGFFSESAEDDLARFAELVAISVSNAETRARLAGQATTDPLTGLANHRAFHERLEAEVARARRHDRGLSLILLDVDDFASLNAAYGHDEGDRVIAEIGRRLAAQVGPDELAARVGGNGFAVILPETSGLDAWSTAEALRTAISARPFGQAGLLTFSGGVCDLARAQGPEDLFRLADGALYWAKAHGRDVVFLYSPEVVQELSAAERAERLERASALAGLRGLARAVDAKDPSTRAHSERVAALAAAVARELGWPEGRVGELHEAGLLHDVGKIGVPDTVLFKPGKLTAEEYEVVKQHAALGAEIVNDVLTPEQAAWVRHHHERVDGGGYPDGLAGDAIPEGARILAVVDAWDVMASVRTYSAPRPPTEALVEMARCVGTQFDAEAAAALSRLAGSRRLDVIDASSGAPAR